MAPWLIEKLGFGTNNSSQASCLIDNPLQSGQHPRGALNENNLGSNVGTEKPHFAQEFFSDNKVSLSPSLITTNPLETSSADSIYS